jgi:putative GTP pyrophosphokinase
MQLPARESPRLSIALLLVRMPAMDITRMEDIGGCRAVLDEPREAAGVLRRIERRWEIARFRDYVTDPRSSGYRAIHVVVTRDGCRIEMQMRTRGQQEWADQVENFASRYRLPLKDEQGPEVVLDYFRLAAQGIYSDEHSRIKIYLKAAFPP